ncbi:iron ABC transporter permease [Alicyclobacillus cycloheptanicus]|uniref:Iron complex transport system permease protein n=1 Tax=Alicyclobacillus cycloheptanicus TaxID=1457 RepID=A0ABT9XEM6_9BACL|nr:iron ABC transporter permease [Alicyclobacillus cycloheptanicus]MDQ0188751.1 iron complex transport system permease protein [Alicyclobacillus cycloheptanicus]WDM00589.1 iron ABC transporter permease [Alicyclobacillus cycloheptanicus]
MGQTRPFSAQRLDRPHANRTGRGKTLVVFVTLAALIFLVFMISLDTGVIRLSPSDVVKTLFGVGTSRSYLILFEFRLPRIVISVLVGTGLALSGCILQSVTRNPLADPGILGVNAGAGLIVLVSAALFPSLMGSLAMPCLAFAGAALTALLIYVLAYKRHEGVVPTRLVLVGISIAAAIDAAILVLELMLDPDNFQFVVTWMAGSIVGTDWNYVLSLLPWLLVIVPFVCCKVRVMNVLNLGDAVAAGLGASVERERIWLLGAAVALAGSCVAVGGGISFVGLIGPHLARRLVGARHERLIPAAALTGALLLISADTLARCIIQSTELPTGLVVAVIGAPYFLYLLARHES